MILKLGHQSHRSGLVLVKYLHDFEFLSRTPNVGYNPHNLHFNLVRSGYPDYLVFAIHCHERWLSGCSFSIWLPEIHDILKTPNTYGNTNVLVQID